MRFKQDWLQVFWESNGAITPRRIPPELRKVLFRKLQMLYAARDPRDLIIPPSNRYETLKGDRMGQCSIRVNDQYRLCFAWADGYVKEVEFCDYHR